MSFKQRYDSSLSVRRAAVLLLRLGMLILLIAAVAQWPLQSLVVYIGIVALVSLGVAVEIWEQRRSTRNIKVVITLPSDDYSDPDETGSR